MADVMEAKKVATTLHNAKPLLSWAPQTFAVTYGNTQLTKVGQSSSPRTCRTAMFVEIPCTAKLSVKNPSLLIFAECRHIDDSPAKQLAARRNARVRSR